MKRAVTLALMITLILCVLPSCSVGEGQSDAERIREKYSACGGVKMNMTLTADYGERVYEFKARFSGTGKSGTLEILAPENIKGLTVAFTEEGGRLEADGVSFDTGALFGNGLSPAEAAPLMLSAWESGYAFERASETVSGEAAAALTFDLDNGAILKTWFDRKTLLPIKAEISENGYTVLTAVFGDVILE